jgi:aryl-alcohol dehydrogenase-like predicted oxidoreductase
MRMDGVRVFHTVQATWNVLERAAGPALDEAHQAGYGVIIKEALANGRLTNLGDQAGGALGAIAKDRGVKADAVAIAAVLANPWVDVVLSGAIGADQLASNLDALSIQLSEAETEELRELTEPSETYWSRRQAQPWS